MAVGSKKDERKNGEGWRGGQSPWKEMHFVGYTIFWDVLPFGGALIRSQEHVVEGMVCGKRAWSHGQQKGEHFIPHVNDEKPEGHTSHPQQLKLSDKRLLERRVLLNHRNSFFFFLSSGLDDSSTPKKDERNSYTYKPHKKGNYHFLIFQQCGSKRFFWYRIRSILKSFLVSSPKVMGLGRR